MLLKPSAPTAAPASHSSASCKMTTAWTLFCQWLLLTECLLFPVLISSSQEPFQVPIQAPAHPSIQPTGKTADSEGIEMKKATSHSRIRLIICLGHRKGSINICFCPYSPSDRNRTAISTSVKPASHHLLDKLLAPFSLWKQHCDRLRTSQPDFTKENPTLFTG